MGGIAEAVAYKMVENASKGKPKTLAAVAREMGVNETYANTTLTQTKAYQRIIAKFRPQQTQRLAKIVKKASQALEKKDFTKERASDLSSIIEKSTKDFQLLTGGATENKAVLISSLLEKIEKEVDGERLTKE